MFNNDNVSPRFENIETLKTKLDSLLMENLEVNKVFDSNVHNYYKANVEDCVLYYISDCIIKNITKKIKCNICLTVTAGMYPLSIFL